MKKQDFIPNFLSVFEGLETTSNEQLLPDTWKKTTVDYVIYQKVQNIEKIPFAFVVCTSNSKTTPVNRTYAKRIIKHIVTDSVAWFGFVVDRNKIFRFSPETQKWVSDISVNDIKAEVSATLARKFNEQEFKETIISEIDQIKFKTKRDEVIASKLKSVIGRSQLKSIGRSVSFEIKQQFELICDLLKSIKVKSSKKFCRYSSISSLFRNINIGCESMCGLAGMNDKSEGFYLDYCLSSNSSFDLYRKPQWIIDDYNKAFIMSLCDYNKTDNLTMWRLYGGKDGDGVCLIYEIDEDKIRDTQEFILSPVMYGNKNNVIVQLFRLLSNLPFANGYQFVLSNKSIWSYFVKPEEFKIEEEHRLLYIHGSKQSGKIKWINNDGVGIVHPIVEFNNVYENVSHNFPLKLVKIILGPKCKERGVNKVQLRTWFKSRSLQIEVCESNIKIYR